MNINRAGAGATLTVALLLAGCSDATPGTSASSSTASQTSTPSTSVSATATKSDSPEAKAEAAVVAFWTELDRLASDPSKPLSDLSSVARDQALAQWQRNLTEMRGQGYTQVGAVVVSNSAVTGDATSGRYSVTACIDVSKVNVVDQSGKSVVAANRAPRTKYSYDVQRDGEKFFVIKDPLKGDAC